jgi:hypothetical protein
VSAQWNSIGARCVLFWIASKSRASELLGDSPRDCFACRGNAREIACRNRLRGSRGITQPRAWIRATIRRANDHLVEACSDCTCQVDAREKARHDGGRELRESVSEIVTVLSGIKPDDLGTRINSRFVEKGPVLLSSSSSFPLSAYSSFLSARFTNDCLAGSFAGARTRASNFFRFLFYISKREGERAREIRSPSRARRAYLD